MRAWLETYRGTDEFRQARDALERPRAELGGLWGSAFAFFLAAWRLEDSGRATVPALVLTAGQEEAEELAGDLEELTGGGALGFPAWDSLFLEDSEPDPEVFQDRVRALDALLSGDREAGVIVAPVQALLQPVPRPEALRATRMRVERGEERSPERLAESLVHYGYRNVARVERPGEFSRRGDVLDVWPYSRPQPLRLEYFGDVVESMREFDPASQRSHAGGELDAVRLAFPRVEDVFRDLIRDPDDPLLFDWLPAGAAVLVVEPEAVAERASRVVRHVLGEPGRAREVRDLFLSRLEAREPAAILPVPGEGDAPARADLDLGTVERFRATELERGLEALRSALDGGERVALLCEGEGERRRLLELLPAALAEHPGLSVEVESLRSGFTVRAIGAAAVTARELLGRHLVRRRRRRPAAESREVQSFLELEPGDFVVHVTHGVARYEGTESFAKDGVEQEFLVLRFRGDVRIYVPVSKIDLVQKYIGSAGKAPVLDRVGGSSWERKKEAVESALFDMASELLEIQAARQERPGLATPPETDLVRRFVAAFPWQDTVDQADISEAIREDMESPRPMDRLICGDVGYGKTELAMRAAFKAVDAGRQVAVLVPTTVLAEQHWRTFRGRFEDFPVTVEVLSRFRTPREQKELLERVAEGRVDILIGTHRLLSGDVHFRNLGLLVVDEEQRFGVAHKEKIKRLRSEVDVLTLSATPIPRTLHMALLGIRDISNLTTPPDGRIPIHTEISRFDRRKLREIAVRELNRDGQVLFIHNRVADLPVLRREIETLVPEAVVEHAHGQMKESTLERKMVRFIEGQVDILIATTIVENGIDIPTANTMVINEADRYGLADLHQLRGRVGRSRQQAYCYVFLPDHRHVNPDARKRLQALVEFSGLGAGFQIAMRDLEIRGAGNILGKEQSGHIAAVGYDMYCRLLDKCVKHVRKESWAEPAQVEVDLAVAARVPEGFLSGEPAKIDLYRRVSRLEDEEAIRDLSEELQDRHGNVPAEVSRLLDVQLLRLLCRKYGVVYVGQEDGNIILKGEETMRSLLETCPRRVVVLDARTVAIPWQERSRRAAVGEERVFDFVLEWMRTGRFPGDEAPRERLQSAARAAESTGGT